MTSLFHTTHLTLLEHVHDFMETIQKRVLTGQSLSASPLVLFPVCQDAHCTTSLTTHRFSPAPVFEWSPVGRKTTLFADLLDVTIPSLSHKNGNMPEITCAGR